MGQESRYIKPGPLPRASQGVTVGRIQFLTVLELKSYLLAGYYGLNVKCPLEAKALNTWSPAGGTILRGCVNWKIGPSCRE